MTQVKVSELTGAALDWAVIYAQCLQVTEGKTILSRDLVTTAFKNGPASPSTDAKEGDPIIAREGIHWIDNGRSDRAGKPFKWMATKNFSDPLNNYYGPTYLIASMRCFAASRFGGVVDIPHELVEFGVQDVAVETSNVQEVKNSREDVKMAKVKVSEATGPVLDWMVAKCDQPVYSDKALVAAVKGGTDGIGIEHEPFNPSTDWAQGGHFIEREKIATSYHPNPNTPGWEPWVASTKSYRADGPNPLIAAMRCYVASKLGEFVDVPQELVGEMPVVAPVMGKLWWNADNLAEAEQWRTDLTAKGATVELKPEVDREVVSVFITLDRSRAKEILGHDVGEEEWLDLSEDADQNDTLQAQRIAALPGLSKLAGPAYTLSMVAAETLKKAGGDPQKVDWLEVDRQTIAISISVNGQTPHSVREALQVYSPGTLLVGGLEAMLKEVARVAQDSPMYGNGVSASTPSP